MKNDRLLAARYAQALSATLMQDSELAAALEDLRALSDSVDRSSELATVLRNPAIPSDQKGRAMRAIGERIGCRAQALNLISALAPHGHLTLIPHVVAATAAELDRRQGVKQVEITTAQKLEAATQQSVERALGKLAGGTVRVAWFDDRSLIGGVVAKIGAKVYDGSLRTRLQQIRARLAG